MRQKYLRKRPNEIEISLENPDEIEISHEESYLDINISCRILIGYKYLTKKPNETEISQ